MHSTIQSLVSFRNSQGDAARGTLLKLDRSAVVFEVYNPYSIVQLSEVLQDLTIRRGERTIYSGRAVVSNLVNTGLMLIVSATLVDTWQDLDGLLDDVSGVREEVERFIQDWKSANRLMSGYLLSVTEIRSFLSELNRWLGQISISPKTRQSQEHHELPTDVFHELSQLIFPRLYKLFRKFEQEAEKIPNESITLHKHYAQRDLHPLLMTSPFVHRTFTKPLGYAGDYEAVNMMMRDAREGPTTYAKLINALHLNTGVAAAHRNRIGILNDYLFTTTRKYAESNKAVNILNIGCGPAQEIQKALASNPLLDRCNFRLVDFNKQTLLYAEKVLREIAEKSGLRPQLEFAQESVHVLLKQAARADATDEEEYELIYCAGLFDYLSDKVCSRLLRLFYKWIKPDGMILATNVHPSNPNRFAMEHILEWYLIYRDKRDMESLLPHFGKQRVFSDETGINIFLEIRKTGYMNV